MANTHPASRYGHASRVSSTPTAHPCIALTENELATRWGLSVKTLRRWRQEQLGPIFCKLGARVTYLISEVEAFERRVSRHSTFTRAYQ
ncbi:helix-turn-helix domain-containing protein [Comamonas aquatica]|uniref:helix-turn-helix transcriptional regulator n=1 Tax=Comamonas TaxID=283 RepID=UPI00244D1DCA|nr:MULTISPECIES: helix-turn-helix domain-containing protein [Comamonas]MDH1380693.1 helix-turn-helix domain-containing protein [Comamonas aquatica]MDH1640613.1 helix-turn-helix domain-containing protein [Comamonas aquatica]